MKHIAMVTTSRSEWGIQRPIAAALHDRNDVRLSIVAGGMHLSEAFGATVSDIYSDGFTVNAGLRFLTPGDTEFDIAMSISQGVAAFARCFAGDQPDLISVLGDRFDMFPAVIAALPLGIPIAHIHGGERTDGSFDDSIRHAITKMSHLHLVSTREYAGRIIQMGESPKHVHCVGAPGLDDIVSHVSLDGDTLQETYGFVEGLVNALVVYHPETRGNSPSDASPAESMSRLLQAVTDSVGTDANIVIVSPNADTGYSGISEVIESFCKKCDRARHFQSIPRRAYLSMMEIASLMVGNSSSGIIEAPSFKTPVVNVGTRQAGRVRAANVIDVASETTAIRRAIDKALSNEFVMSLSELENPYGDGKSAGRIAQILATTDLTPEFLAKRFVDQTVSSPHSFASSTNTRTADSISSKHAHSLGE
ncbi:MAG: UDP-N-acetyl glucosamine 2-epimerase [Phycisphaerae bacterium]|nr:MAG: UDP-N-acetyl glucosamine 2-epimerase [Phycisphaerae bacterium]